MTAYDEGGGDKNTWGDLKGEGMAATETRDG